MNTIDRASRDHRGFAAAGLFLAAGLLVLGVLSHASGPLAQALALLVSTLASEDLTCIAAGQLVRRGDLSAGVAIIGCVLGIFVGDIGLWLAGRLCLRKLPVGRIRQATRWIGDRGAGAVFLARFIPGMRLPVYLAMGAAAVDPIRFALHALLAALLWTPLLIMLVAHLGDLAIRPLERYFGAGYIPLLLGVLAGLIAVRAAALAASATGRARLVAIISRVWRWEFWPSWVFYAPVVPWIGWLSLRYRGFTVITAANPAIPHGGFVGESKFDILSSIRSPHVIPTEVVRGGEPDHRVARVARIMADRGWELPLVFKPDAGQRGAGVKLIRNLSDAAVYLRNYPATVIVQPYHPGPFEAGIFYYRIPSEAQGRILAITDKVFPEVVGDGISTIEQLVWRHPRYRMQAHVFLSRHPAQLVLPAGQPLRLAVAGNHCQGTLFRDGSHLLTPELQRKVDEIAQTIDGFHFGRFDVRYADVEQFKAGKDLAIIELNGITSEATNLYDPSWSLIRAYRLLYAQWAILFRIGAANRGRGVRPSTCRQLACDVFRFYRRPRPLPLAD